MTKNIFLGISIIVLIISIGFFAYSYRQSQSGLNQWDSSKIGSERVSVSNVNFENVYLEYSISGPLDSIEPLGDADNSFKVTLAKNLYPRETMSAVLSTKYKTGLYDNTKDLPTPVTYDEFVEKLVPGKRVSIKIYEDLRTGIAFIDSGFLNN